MRGNIKAYISMLLKQWLSHRLFEEVVPAPFSLTGMLVATAVGYEFFFEKWRKLKAMRALW